MAARSAETIESAVLEALTTRLQLLLTDITECIETEADANVIDYVRDCSEDLYQILANLAAQNPEMYSDLLHQSRLLVDVLQDPILNVENYVPPPQTLSRSTPGRPKFEISKEQLQYLIEHGFTGVQIGNMLGISLSTLRRRMRELQLHTSQPFSPLTEEELDRVVNEIKHLHPKCGYRMMIGHLRSRGLRVQQSRVRASLRRVDPEGTVVRWMAAVHRRKYCVRGPNSLWYIDVTTNLSGSTCVFKMYLEKAKTLKDYDVIFFTFKIFKNHKI